MWELKDKQCKSEFLTNATQCKACQQCIEQWLFQAWAESIIFFCVPVFKIIQWQYRKVTSSNLHCKAMPLWKTISPSSLKTQPVCTSAFSQVLQWKKKRNTCPTAPKLAISKKCFNCLQEVKNLEDRSKCLCLFSCVCVCVCVNVHVCVYFLWRLSAFFKANPNLARFYAVDKIASSSNIAVTHRMIFLY